jgi:HEPN domain-containing protein
LKAYYEATLNDTPPFTHNLPLLVKKTNLIELISDEQKDFLNYIDPLNIEARYPAHKEKRSKILTKEKCNEILIATKEFTTWIKKKLLKS